MVEMSLLDFSIWIFNLFGSLFVIYDGLNGVDKYNKHLPTTFSENIKFSKFKIWFGVIVFPWSVLAIMNAKVIGGI